MSLLEVRSVSHRFGGVQALHDVSVSVEEGEIRGLIGPNGSGKTTLFNTISRMFRLQDGALVFEGKVISRTRPHRLAHLGLVRTFQNLRLFDGMTVAENIMVGHHAATRSEMLRSVIKDPVTRSEEASIRQGTARILEDIGLQGQAYEQASSLSYGQKRLLEIGRAVASSPRLLLLDEPGAGLTAAEAREMTDVLGRLRDAGITIFLIEHNMDLIMGLCDRVLVLESGRAIADGSAQDVQSDERVIEAYLGFSRPLERRYGGARTP